MPRWTPWLLLPMAALLAGQAAPPHPRDAGCRRPTPVARFDAFVEARADATLRRCRRFGGCVGVTRASLRAELFALRVRVASGELVLDPVEARRCLRTSICDRVVQPRCASPPEAPCTSDTECDDAHWCDGGDGSCPGRGRCRPRTPLGESCSADQSCALVTGRALSACLEREDGSSVCGTLAVQPVPFGQPCADGAQRSRAGPRGVGVFRWCNEGWCDHGVCTAPQPPGTEGAVCDDPVQPCAAGLGCDHGHCRALEGIACSETTGCPDALDAVTACEDGHCVVTDGERGSPCDVGQRDCAAGSGCGDDGRCGELRAVGGACGLYADGECATACCDVAPRATRGTCAAR